MKSAGCFVRVFFLHAIAAEKRVNNESLPKNTTKHTTMNVWITKPEIAQLAGTSLYQAACSNNRSRYTSQFPKIKG